MSHKLFSKMKMLVGHSKEGDYYTSPSGEWLYTGHTKKDFKNSKFWKWLGK
jgi:hypothetical protein